MKKNPIPYLFLVLLFLLAISLAACTPRAEKVEYTIEMSEFAYSPDSLELKVGQEVTLILVNKGALAHELMVGRNVIMEDGKPDGHEQDMFAGQEPTVVMGQQMEHDMGSMDNQTVEPDHGHSGFMVSVPGQDKATLTFLVTEEMVGEWEMGCFLDSGAHYTQGMKGTLVVTP